MCALPWRHECSKTTGAVIQPNTSSEPPKAPAQSRDRPNRLSDSPGTKCRALRQPFQRPSRVTATRPPRARLARSARTVSEITAHPFFLCGRARRSRCKEPNTVKLSGFGSADLQKSAAQLIAAQWLPLFNEYYPDDNDGAAYLALAEATEITPSPSRPARSRTSSWPSSGARPSTLT